MIDVTLYNTSLFGTYESFQNFRRAPLVHEPDPKIWVIGTMGGIILIVIFGKVHIHRVGKYMIALLSW